MEDMNITQDNLSGNKPITKNTVKQKTNTWFKEKWRKIAKINPKSNTY